MSAPTLDGQAIFGLAVQMMVTQNPNAHQIVEFFGIDGLFSLYGGQRGQVAMISGILVDISMAYLNADEAAIMAFADGDGHTLIDTRGREWDNMIFKGEFKPTGPVKTSYWPDGYGGMNVGYGLPYGMIMYGLG